MKCHLEVSNIHQPASIKVTFSAKEDELVVQTHLNTIDGIKKVNIGSDNCKKHVIVYLLPDSNVNQIAIEIKAELEKL
jgi:hypothetical protein